MLGGQCWGLAVKPGEGISWEEPFLVVTWLCRPPNGVFTHVSGSGALALLPLRRGSASRPQGASVCRARPGAHTSPGDEHGSGFVLLHVRHIPAFPTRRVLWMFPGGVFLWWGGWVPFRASSHLEACPRWASAARPAF